MTFEETFVQVMETENDNSKQCFIVCWKDDDGKENWTSVGQLTEAITLQKILVVDYNYRPVAITAVMESTDHMIHPNFDSLKEN